VIVLHQRENTVSELLQWQVGKVRITRVQELEAPGMRFIVPQATIENLAEIAWLTPQARYIVARPEWEHWSASNDPWSQMVMADSVRPIFDAGMADLVETDHQVHDAIRFEPTPGHTPGHVSVRIRSQGEEAVITGDLVHHPCQFARPDWGSSADADAEQADRTRKAFMARYADTPTLIIGTHFAGPTAGRLVRDGKAYRLAV
jgi:glyoxylase-like metal-dependent hydrolase (beta-lactamase superfamily II)